MAKKKEKDKVSGGKKINKSVNLTNAAKYERHLKLSAARQRKCKENMSEERLEAKRRRDRERYYRLKNEEKIKHVKDMSDKEKAEARKVWKKRKAAYRKKKKEEKTLLQNTPPNSDIDDVGLAENSSQDVKVSRQQQVGRRKVRQNKSKAYRELKKTKKDNDKLRKEVAKLRKRLSRVKEKEKKKTESGVSPSPNKKVRELVGREKVSPNIKKRLFVGYTLEKQIKENIKSVKARGKDRHIIHKSIGSRILRKYRVQNELRALVPYSFTRNETKCDDDSLTLDYKKKTYNTVKVEEARNLRKFFERDDVSKMLPGKKDYVKRGGVKKQRRLLLDNMTNLYAKFRNETNITISYTVFTRCRPFWVTSPTARDRETCACIKHENINFLVSALKTVNAVQYKDTAELLQSVVCSTKNEICMTNKCAKCKPLQIEYTMEDDIQVSFWKWTTVTEKKLIKNEERSIKRTVKSQISASFIRSKAYSQITSKYVKGACFLHETSNPNFERYHRKP